MCLKDKVHNNHIQGSGGPSGSNKVRRKLCFDFNCGNCMYGKKCKFDHRCSFCNKFGHGAVVCHKAGNKGEGNQSAGPGHDRHEVDRWDKYEKGQMKIAAGGNRK